MSDAVVSSAVLEFPYGESLSRRLGSRWIVWFLSFPCMFAGGFMLRATLTNPAGPDGTFIACGAPFVLIPPLLFLYQFVAHRRGPRIRIAGTEIVQINGGARLPLGDAAGAEAVVIERTIETGTFSRSVTASEAQLASHMGSNVVTGTTTSEVYDVRIGDVVVTHVVNEFKTAKERAHACAEHLGLPVVGPGDRFAK